MGKFQEHLVFSRTRETKSPIIEKGLFKAFKRFLVLKACHTERSSP